MINESHHAIGHGGRRCLVDEVLIPFLLLKEIPVQGDLLEIL